MVVVLLGLPPAARAQQIATSFEQLRVLLKPGDTVTVTDATGNETKGRILSLSSSSLELSVGDTSRIVAESAVRTISQRRHASFGTGAKWGFFIGASLGALAGVAAASEGYSAGESVAWGVVGAAVYGGMGAGIGVGVSGLIRGPHLVYAGRPTSAKLTLSPVLLAGRKGVGASLRF